MRGLQTLRDLPRVMLAEPVDAEVSVASVVAAMGLDGGRGTNEREVAHMSVFALGFRNGDATADMIGKLFGEGVSAVDEPVYSGELKGRETAALYAARYAVWCVLSELGTKSGTAAMRGAAEKRILAGFGKTSKLNCTAARYAELLPMLLELRQGREFVELLLLAGARESRLVGMCFP